MRDLVKCLKALVLSTALAYLYIYLFDSIASILENGWTGIPLPFAVALSVGLIVYCFRLTKDYRDETY